MQLNKTKAGSVSCLDNEAKASPPGSDHQGILFRNYLKAGLLLFFVFLGSYLMAGEPNPKITLNKRNSTLQEIFREIQRQTKYAFVYNNEMMRETKRIDIDVREASLEEVLRICFKDQPVTYSLVDQIVVVREKTGDKQAGNKDTASVNLKYIDINGKILDELSNPIAKATIAVKNTTNVTTTDNRGIFQLSDVPVNARLLISCVGYEPVIVIAKNNTPVLANLKVAVNPLDEAVVVAYNTTTQRANTGSVFTIRGDQIKSLPGMSFDKRLQGQVPGLAVTPGSGQPGSAPANFTLRGIATGGNPLNGESFRNPLIVIDGIPVSQDPANSLTLISSGIPTASNPMAQLNPSDIESITILKDAAAASLYGSKASNGVIIVTTKKGKSGNISITFRDQTTIASRLNGKIDVLNREQYLSLIKEAYKNANPANTDDFILSEIFKRFPYIKTSPTDSSFYPEASWKDAIYDRHAISNTAELSASGGNARSNFYLNFEWSKENGVVKKTDYDRKSLRFNYEARPSNWVRMGINSSFSYNIQRYNVDNGMDTYISPLLPIRNQQNEFFYNFDYGLGSGGAYFAHNPVASAQLNINRNNAYRTLNSVNISINPVKFLTLNSVTGVDFMLNESKRKVHPNFVLSGDLQPGKGSITDESYRHTSFINTNTLQFNHTFSRHIFQLLLGQETQMQARKMHTSTLVGFGDNPELEEIAANGNVKSTGFTARFNMLSFFSQLSYNFNNRYYLSASLRKDGASQFGKNNRFGTFWSAGMGWIITEEKIIKENLAWLEFLKVRGSLGSSGNSSAIANQLRFDPLYTLLYMGRTALIPQHDVSPGNPDIQWESTFNWNIGMELKLFKSRISVSADVYTRKTKNLIANNITLPSASGFAFFADNIGDIRNRGIEISISAYPVRAQSFTWQLSANLSRNSNILTRAFYPENTIYGVGKLINKVGEEYNSFYLPVWAGVNPANGRPQWIDSLTGKPTEDYNAAKRIIAGKVQPDGFGNITNVFSYKGFDLTIGLNYQFGSQIYFAEGSTLVNDGLDPFLNQSTIALDRWQKPNDIAKNPRRLAGGTIDNPSSPDEASDKGTSASTRYLFDGDFIRVSNINIGYNFPKTISSKFKLATLRLYVQGNNLATWTKYSGKDPDNINAFGSGEFLYPIAKSFSFGVIASF